MYGLHPQLDDRLSWSSGTKALCRAAGITHGTFPGTSVPYIWTIDLAVTLAWLPPEDQTCALISVKPLQSKQYSGDIDPTGRGPEKLEIERRYAAELSIPYFVGDRSIYPGPLLGQLEWLSSSATLQEHLPAWRGLQELLQHHGPELRVTPPTEWLERLTRDFRLSVEDAGFVLRHIMWNQLVDIDLARFIDMNESPRPGGLHDREMLRKLLQRGLK